MSPEGGNRTGFALVTIAAALWATVGVSVSLVPEAQALPADMLGFLRLGLAGPAILLLWLATGTRRLAALRALDPIRLMAFAAASAVFQVCLFRCFDALGVAITVFLTVCLPPALAVLWALLRGSVGLNAGVARALVCAVAGLALISVADAKVPGGERDATGLLLAIAASVAWVAASAAARDLARAAPSMLVAGVGLSLAAALMLAASAARSEGSFAAAFTSLSDPRLIALVLYLGLGPTALAYVCFCVGMARCRSVAIGLVVSMVEPAVAAALAILLLRENMRLPEVIGCALVLAGMVVLWRAETRRTSVESG